MRTPPSGRVRSRRARSRPANIIAAALARRLFRFLVPFPAALSLVWTLAAGASTSSDDHLGFDGIWNSATATPLERPNQLKDKAFFTPEEAVEWERQVGESNQEPSSQTASKNVGTGTY